MKKFSVTNLIILVNIAMFIISRYILEFNYVVVYTSLNSPITKWYINVFTSAFMHGNLLHLGFNMYFLYIVGNIIENYLGKYKYVLYYMFCIVLTGLTTTLLSDEYTIGASGVLFAMLTTLIVLDYYQLPGIRVNGKYLLNILLLNIVLTFLLNGISVIGHLSGIATGIIVSIMIISMVKGGSKYE